MTTTQERAEEPTLPPRVRPGRRAEPAGSRSLPIALAALVVAQSLVIGDVDLPVVRPLVALGTFWLLPALVLHRRAPWLGEARLPRAAYALGLSLLALLVVGFLVNAITPVLGIARPLTPAVLGVTWLLVDAALLTWRSSVPLLPPIDRAAVRSVARRAWLAPVEPAQALGVAAVVVAVVGAVRLNNGAGGEVAIAGHVLAVAAIAALLLRGGSLGRDLRTVYLVALALLLATSLRGWGVTGHDVQVEFYVFDLTADAQRWSMDLLQNAYTACLSVTLLPTMLVETTGLSGTWWFKVGLQLLFAALPVVSYLTFRRFVSRRLAVVAVTFLVAFPTFSGDMPYLVRQEVAFLFLALVLLAATDSGLPLRARRALVVVLGVGVVLSHYSTTYLLVIGLVGGLVVLGLVTLLARRLRWVRDEQPLVLLHPLVVALVAGSSMLWTGPITGTGSHPLEVAQDAIVSLLGGDDEPGSNDRRFFLLGGEEQTARQRLNDFARETERARQDYPRDLFVFTDPGRELKRPPILEEDTAPLTPVGEVLEKVVDPGTVVVGARLASAALLQVLLLAGVGWLVLARWRALRGREPVETDDVSRSATALESVSVVLGVMGAMGLVVVVPSLSVEYGVLRAFMQTMLVVAPVAAIGLWWALRLVRRPTWVAGVTIALLAVLTSTVTALVGGGPPKLALADAGVYHERYIVEDSDEVAIDHLAQASDTSKDLPKVLAPTNQTARLALAGVSIDEVDGRTFPTALNVGSYFFADSRITGDRKDTLFLDGDRVTYRYPLGRVEDRLDLVYSAGQSRVYR